MDHGALDPASSVVQIGKQNEPKLTQENQVLIKEHLNEQLDKICEEEDNIEFLEESVLGISHFH